MPLRLSAMGFELYLLGNKALPKKPETSGSLQGAGRNGGPLA